MKKYQWSPYALYKYETATCWNTRMPVWNGVHVDVFVTEVQTNRYMQPSETWMSAPILSPTHLATQDMWPEGKPLARRPQINLRREMY